MAFPHQQVVLSLKESSGPPSKYLALSPSKYSKFYVTDVFNPKSKFIFENAKNGAHNGYVHIISSNNRYWVREAPSDFIKSTAEEANEDRASARCTLFRAILMNGNREMRLVHVQTGRDVGRYKPGHNLVDCLTVQSSDILETHFNIINYQFLVKLPRRVVFRGDNDQLLGWAYSVNKTNFNWFRYTDIADPKAGYEVFHARNGDARVKSNHVGKFWTGSYPGDLSYAFVLSISDTADENNPQVMFGITVHNPTDGNNAISIRSRANNHYCRRYTNTAGNVHDSLANNAPTMTDDTKITVLEPVIERMVNVIKYRLDQVRIYNQEVKEIHLDANNGSSTEETYALNFSEKMVDTRSWKNTEKLSKSEKFSMTFGFPKLELIGDMTAQVVIDSQMTESYTWGEELKEDRTIGDLHTVVVPPRTKVTVRMRIRRATCDIPCTYSQTVRFTNGDWQVATVHDGYFTGVHSYFVDYVSQEYPY